MPLVHGLFEQVKHAGPGPVHFIDGGVGVPDDGVGNAKTDPGNVLGHAVGVVAQDVDDVAAILAQQTAGVSGVHAGFLQKAHQLPGGVMGLPGPGDAPGRLFADAGHLGEPIGIGLDHRQGVGLEMTDDPVDQPGTHALDETRFQVAANAVHRGRQKHGKDRERELLAIAGMGLPASPDLYRFPDTRLGHGAFDGDGPVVFIGSQPGDGEVILPVVIGDPLDVAGKGDFRRGRHGLKLGRSRIHCAARSRSAAT